MTDQAAAPDRKAPTKLEHALAAARIGFRVFPLEPNTGHPAIEDWPALATRDEAQLRNWWARWPDANIGLETTGLCVIDVDVKKGKQGIESLKLLRLTDGALPTTYVQGTPSGGAHIVFNAQGADVRNSTSKHNGLGDGIDIRGWHGFIVGAGSTKGGKAYTAGPCTTIAPAPQWLLSRVRPAVPPQEKQREPAAELDTDEAAKRVREYLENFAPLSIENDGGDDTAFRVAARVKDLGVSRDQALALMLEHWNERCEPPWDPDELEDKVRNAYRYGENAPASGTPEAAFAGLELPPDATEPPPPKQAVEVAEPLPGTEAAAEHPPSNVLQWDDDDDTPEPDSLVDGLIGQGEIVLVYGKPGVGKSFVVMRLGHSVSSGLDFAGRTVERGAVLYVAVEGHGGIRKRRKALRKVCGGRGLPFDFLVANVNLARNKADRAMIRKAADELVTRTGQPLRMVVIDTGSAASPGMDENAAGEVSALLQGVRAIVHGTGAAAIVIHHEGKSRNNGPRGSSAFTGNVDVQIRITEGLIESDKEREAGKIYPIRFDLQTVDVGRTRRGKPVTSCVARVYSETESAFVEQKMTDAEKQAFDILRELCLAEGTEEEPLGWVRIGAWRNAYKAEVLGHNRALDEAERQMWKGLRDGLRHKDWTRENDRDCALVVEK